MLLTTPSVADAVTTVSSCPNANEAPAGFTGGTCNNFCTFVGGVLTCDVPTVCAAGAAATVVGIFDTAANNDYTAWVDCGMTNYCCAVDEDTGVGDAIDKVVLQGGIYDDELSFVYTPNGSELTPTAPHDMDAEMYGGDEDCFHFGQIGDLMFGSTFSGGNYSEILYGQAGCDDIHGYGGADKIFGGDHDDTCDGGPGADRIDCGAGTDISIGGTGTDTLCDTECTVGAAGQDYFDGGDDNDRLWYDGTCGVVGLAAGSTAGNGNGDECGDAAVFGPYPWLACESNLTGSAPTTCP